MAIKKSNSVVGWLRNYYTITKNKTKIFLLGKANIRDGIQITREANLRLTGGKVVWGELKNGDTSPKNPWAALSAAREKIGKIKDCLIVVSLYNQVRTYFTQNY